MEFKRIICIFFLLFASRPIWAATVFMEGGLHFGGDTLATVVFFDGDTQTVKAGRLFSASIGMVGDVGDDMEMRVSIGLKADGIFAANGEVDFTRFPLEFMLFTKAEVVSFGLGLSYHLDPSLSVTGPVVSGGSSTDFDDALGVVAEVDYKLGTDKKAYVGIKATFIDYEPSNAGAVSISGNSLGIVIGFRF
jgi:hypothetical protein